MGEDYFCRILSDAYTTFPAKGGYIAVAADYALQVQEFTARYAMEVTDPKAALQSGNIFESGEVQLKPVSLSACMLLTVSLVAFRLQPVL